MEWEYYNGQELKTGDLIVCDKGGLACINSGYTTGEPSRIDSIPESWSAEMECLDTATGIMRTVGGDIFDRIIKYMRVVI
jgi:hypothetical protein